MSDRVGGNWVFADRNGQSRIYRSLHINTSRERMAYADFPMPADYPDFPHHALIADYFAAYAARFCLDERITFGTAVTRAEQLAPEHWRVTLSTGESRDYASLIVANGHHWDPRWPDPPLPGRFAGTTIHSHDYV
jgi:cation diffusion facilitator CzcD-associated flavoprotein CzcO